MEISIDDINYKTSKLNKINEHRFYFYDMSKTLYTVDTKRKTLTINDRLPISYVHLYFIFKNHTEFSTDMTMNDYQEQAKRFANYESKYTIDGVEMPWEYPVSGIAGEAGEVAEKFKKVFRNDKGILTDEKRHEIKQELGDLLWYLSETARQLNFTFEEVGKSNISKLDDRNKRGVLNSEGDNR